MEQMEPTLEPPNLVARVRVTITPLDQKAKSKSLTIYHITPDDAAERIRKAFEANEDQRSKRSA